LRPAIEGIPQRVHHAAEKAITDADIESPSGQMGRCAGSEAFLLTEQDGADALAAEMEHQRLAAILETQDLVHRRRGQPLDPGDAVADRRQLADFADPQLRLVAGEPLAAQAASVQCRWVSDQACLLPQKRPVRRPG
jgi:hypothetical protein